MSDEKRIPTSERLAATMEADGCPDWMIKKAREFGYDDYKSQSATPCIELVADLSISGHMLLADRAKNGEFDAQKWESDEWAKTDEAKQIGKSFGSVVAEKMFGIKI